VLTQLNEEIATAHLTGAFEGVRIMSSFSEIILKAINEYRSLLRKNTPTEQRKSKLREFGLDGRYSELSDIDLYNTAKKMSSDLQLSTKDKAPSQYTYSGSQNFIKHLNDILDQYHIHGNKILHCTQLASRASIESIQLLALPEDKLRLESTIKRLAKSNYLIARFGSDAQRAHHVNNLKSNRERNKPFFDGILSNFETTLHKLEKEAQANH
jgi:hypothetical protein